MLNGCNNAQDDEAPPANSNNWESYNADRSGHLRFVDIDDLHQICEKENIKIKILVPESRFLLEGTPLFSADKNLEEKLVNSILEKFVLSTRWIS